MTTQITPSKQVRHGIASMYLDTTRLSLHELTQFGFLGCLFSGTAQDERLPGEEAQLRAH
jgi:hypothetical protein